MPGKAECVPSQPSPAQPSPAAGPGRPTPHCWPGLAGATRLDCRHCSFVNPEVYSLSPLIFYTLPFSFNHVCFLARGLLAFNLFSLCLVKELSQISQRESSVESSDTATTNLRQDFRHSACVISLYPCKGYRIAAFTELLSTQLKLYNN